MITVRFRDAHAARAAHAKMDGRYFAGRQITALLVEGRPKFRRSLGNDPEEAAGTEHRRADAFGAWLDRGGDHPDGDCDGEVARPPTA